jgi:hypothetical protein
MTARSTQITTSGDRTGPRTQTADLSPRPCTTAEHEIRACDQLGDLAKCFDYTVLPVTRIVEPPHGESDWRLLVSLVFTKPGRYPVYLLKVDYVEDGQRHWDYVRADISLRAISPSTDPRLLQPAC